GRCGLWRSPAVSDRSCAAPASPDADRTNSVSLVCDDRVTRNLVRVLRAERIFGGGVDSPRRCGESCPPGGGFPPLPMGPCTGIPRGRWRGDCWASCRACDTCFWLQPSSALRFSPRR